MSTREECVRILRDFDQLKNSSSIESVGKFAIINNDRELLTEYFKKITKDKFSQIEKKLIRLNQYNACKKNIIDDDSDDSDEDCESINLKKLRITNEVSSAKQHFEGIADALSTKTSHDILVYCLFAAEVMVSYYFTKFQLDYFVVKFSSIKFSKKILDSKIFQAAFIELFSPDNRDECYAYWPASFRLFLENNLTNMSTNFAEQILNDERDVFEIRNNDSMDLAKCYVLLLTELIKRFSNSA